jgi:uncharacterized protein (DUF362 family)
MSDLETTLNRLAELAVPEGGWPYAANQQPHPEPTCLALLALAADPTRYAAALTAGTAWLNHCALSDGSYRLPTGRHEAAWPTALVLFTRIALGHDSAQWHKTVAALLALKGRSYEIKEDDINDINGTLVGWPWAEGTFSWVEPTAWAILALRAAGQGHHPRLAEAQQLLLDRVLATGGLNYGNRRVFGITLEPIPTPTALALLALQGHPSDERIDRSLDYLRTHSLQSDDLEHLGWATLALDAYRPADTPSQTIEQLRDRLIHAYEQRASTPYLREAPLRLALLALALNVEQRNPFRLSASQAVQPPMQPGRLAGPSRTLGERIQGIVQGLAVRALSQVRTVEPTSAVHIAPASDYNANLVDVLARQYECFRAQVPLAGKRVVLKPNLVEYHRDKVINTNPAFVAAVIELCQREQAAEVIVAEGPGHWRNVEYLVQASGLGEVLRHYKVPFVDLNHDDPIRKVNLCRLTRLEYLYLSSTIVHADVLISLPKFKTHHWAGATLSLKNLFGTMPGICYGWPKNELHWRGIDNSIVDIAATRMPDLAIVDAIVGMEGDGPLNGKPRHMGLIVMGTDLVAVDATCCRLMQLDPTRIPYLLLASQKKLGLLAEAAIQQLGERIEERRQPFDTVPAFRPLWIGRGA